MATDWMVWYIRSTAGICLPIPLFTEKNAQMQRRPKNTMGTLECSCTISMTIDFLYRKHDNLACNSC